MWKGSKISESKKSFLFKYNPTGKRGKPEKREKGQFLI